MEESLLVSRVTSSLSFVLYLETHRSQFMSKTCSSERIMRIMSTFLISMLKDLCSVPPSLSFSP